MKADLLLTKIATAGGSRCENFTHSEAFTDVTTRSDQFLNKDIGRDDSLPNVGELSRKVYPLPSDLGASPNMNGDSRV